MFALRVLGGALRAAAAPAAAAAQGITSLAHRSCLISAGKPRTSPSGNTAVVWTEGNATAAASTAAAAVVAAASSRGRRKRKFASSHVSVTMGTGATVGVTASPSRNPGAEAKSTMRHLGIRTPALCDPVAAVGTQHHEGVAPSRAVSSSSSRPAGESLTDLFQLLSRSRRNLSTATGAELPPELDMELQEHLGKVMAEDLRVGEDDVSRIRSRTGLGYQEVYSGPEMTVCIFLLRAGARIPLHDHPGMHVRGRLLFGRMRVASFDVVSSVHADGSVWAEYRGEEVYGPQPTTYGLKPQEGNIHELEALSHCAFFDVLAPPYDPRYGRNCTYYRCEQLEDGGSRCLLVPTEVAGFYMDTLQYRGPAFAP